MSIFWNTALHSIISKAPSESVQAVPTGWNTSTGQAVVHMLINRIMNEEKTITSGMPGAIFSKITRRANDRPTSTR